MAPSAVSTSVSRAGRNFWILLPSPGNTERPQGAKLKASCCLTIPQCLSGVMAMSCRGHPVGCFPLSPNRKMHLLPPFPSVHLEKPRTCVSIITPITFLLPRIHPNPKGEIFILSPLQRVVPRVTNLHAPVNCTKVSSRLAHKNLYNLSQPNWPLIWEKNYRHF